MPCQRCKSERLMRVDAHCSDMCNVSIQGVELEKHGGHVPYKMNIGGGDDVRFAVCMDCGQQQGKWPLENTSEVQEKLDEANAPKRVWTCTRIPYAHSEEYPVDDEGPHTCDVCHKPMHPEDEE